MPEDQKNQKQPNLVPEQPTTSENREKLVNEFTEHLKADGVPGNLIAHFKTQGDLCYMAYVAGNMAAKRMVMEGDITEERRFEVAFEFAKIIAMKTSLVQAPSPVVAPGSAGAVPVGYPDGFFEGN